LAASPTSSFKYKLGDFEADLQECVVPPTQTLHSHRSIGSNRDSERLKKVYSFIRSDLEDLSQRWSIEWAQHCQCVLSRQEELFRGNLSKYEELLKGLAEQCASLAHAQENRAKCGASADMTSQTTSSTCAKFGTGHLEVAEEAGASQAEPEPTALETESASPSSTGSDKPSFLHPPTKTSHVRPTRKSGDAVAELIRLDIASKRRTVKMASCSQEFTMHDVPLCERVMQAFRSDRFEHLSCLVTFLNFLFYGIEVHVMATQHNATKHLALTVMMMVFSVYFFWELTMRLVAHRLDFFIGEDKWWNLVDGLVVMASVTEVIMDILQLDKMFFRFAQIFRMLRIFRIIKAFRFLQDLKTLIHSIISTMHQLFWTIALIFMLLYMFAIIFTEATTASGIATQVEQGAWPCEESPADEEPCALQTLYGDLFTSMLTLYMSITGGMDWSDAYNPLQGNTGFLFASLFLIYVTFTTLAVMNVVTAIFCQSAIDGAASQREVQMQKFEEQREMYSTQLKDLFMVMDLDSSGDLTMDEFEIGVMNPRVQTLFESLELSIQEARLLFNLLRSGEDDAIDIDDFVDGCLQLRGSARNFDVALLRYESRHLSNKITELLDSSKDLLAPG